jgi:hypothetical protein
MLLSKIATYALQGLSVPQKQELAEAVDCNIKTLYKWITENKDNGPLTRKSALKFMAATFDTTEDALLGLKPLQAGEFNVEPGEYNDDQDNGSFSDKSLGLIQ